MSFDPWRGWQALAGAWMPPPAAAAPAPSVGEFAERFQKAAEAFLNVQPSGSWAAGHEGAAAEAFTRFLREQFAPFGAPWGSSAPASPGSAAGAAPLPGGAAFGPSREYQERAQRMTDASARLMAAQQRLQLLWSDTLREAASAFVTGVAPAPQAGSDAVRTLYDRWIDCAEDAYARMAHSQSYCDALADCINASSQWRAEQQILVEQWAKLFDLPTRSELNTLMQRIQSLEQAVRQPKASAPQEAVPQEAVPQRSVRRPARRKGVMRARKKS